MEFIKIKSGERSIEIRPDHIATLNKGDEIDGPCISMTCGTRVHVNEKTMATVRALIGAKGKEIESPQLGIRYRV